MDPESVARRRAASLARQSVVEMDLSVGDVHAPSSIGQYAAGYHVERDPKKAAAFCLVFNDAGEVLTVSRPEPPH